VPPPRALSSWLRTQMIDAEREELLDARQDGRLSDGNLRVLERELDFQEQLLR
jgi:monovalent cation/hydrogen antiporter